MTAASAAASAAASPSGANSGHLGGREYSSHTGVLSGRGEVYSFSTMYNAPQGYEEQKPYTIALVKLDEGPMVTAQLTDVDSAEVHIGMRVEMVTRKLREEGAEGQIIYGYKFRPSLGA
jgi:uncharacterized OB-fold protein